MQAVVQRIAEFVDLFECAAGQRLGDVESWSDPVLCPGTEATCSRPREERDEEADVVDGVEDVELGEDADMREVEVVEVLRTTSGGPDTAVAVVSSTLMLAYEALHAVEDRIVAEAAHLPSRADVALHIAVAIAGSAAEAAC